MNDFIRRADALSYPLSFDHYDKENGSREFICGVESYREYIQHLPSVSAERVGEWIFKDNDGGFAGEYHCGNCGKRAEVDLYGEWILSNYCPNCGARMENEK